MAPDGRGAVVEPSVAAGAAEVGSVCLTVQGLGTGLKAGHAKRDRRDALQAGRTATRLWATHGAVEEVMQIVCARSDSVDG